MRDNFRPEIQTGSPERGCQTGFGAENISSFLRQYLENGTRYVQSYS